MLKTMKTAKELDFKIWEYKNLIKVRDMFIEGKITEAEFDMNTACVKLTCGTVGCIGGWMAMLRGMTEDQVSVYVFSNSPHEIEVENPILSKLFFPPEGDDDIEWEAITPEHAVQAINNVLYNGDPDWESILPKV